MSGEQKPEAKKPEVKREDEGRRASRLPLLLTARRPLLAFFLLLTAYCSPLTVQAQKKPKPALKEKDARSAVAAAPGFALRTGAVKVKEISPAGSSPVTVVADVKVAFRFESVEDERVPQTTGIFKQKRLRAVEFRTGDREWERFDLIAPALGAEKVEAARLALESLVTEFGERLRVSEGAKVEPLVRGPLTISQLSAMGSSVVAEVTVEAVFRLARDARGKWQVSDLSVGGEGAGGLAELWRRVNEGKAERARRDLETIRAALEAYRVERGFYVTAEDSVVLMDHLAPFYIKRIIRLDPWNNPYRYAGSASAFALASDGPDGKAGTPDDVTLAR